MLFIGKQLQISALFRPPDKALSSMHQTLSNKPLIIPITMLPCHRSVTHTWSPARRGQSSRIPTEGAGARHDRGGRNPAKSPQPTPVQCMVCTPATRYAYREGISFDQQVWTWARHRPTSSNARTRCWHPAGSARDSVGSIALRASVGSAVSEADPSSVPPALISAKKAASWVSVVRERSSWPGAISPASSAKTTTSATDGMAPKSPSKTWCE